jgi:DNA polymerase III subunit delta'
MTSVTALTDPPNFFAPLRGQDPAVQLLTQALGRRSLAPAYLFTGSAGIGKALAAHCWLEMILCQDLPLAEIPLTCQKIRQGNHPDIHWVAPTYTHQGQLLSAAEAAEAGVKKKAPPQIRIEQVREIGQFLARPPLVADRQLVVIEGAEAMAEGAANALLKTLEEPGAATLILLADPGGALLPTIVSRCQKIPFRCLSAALTIEILTQGGYGELAADPMILGISQGSPGRAIELWEQLQPIPADLRQALCARPEHIRGALQVAKRVDQELDNLAQLALLEYLQFFYWQSWRNEELVKALAESRRQLLAYVQPRLVWECLLLSLLPGG